MTEERMGRRQPDNQEQRAAQRAEPVGSDQGRAGHRDHGGSRGEPSGERHRPSAIEDEIGRDQPAEDASGRPQGQVGIDPREGALAHRDPQRPDQHRDQLAEVRVVTDQDGLGRVAGIVQERLEALEGQVAAQSIVDADRDREVERDQLGRARGPDLGRGDDGVRREADARQVAAQAVGLAFTLLGERPRRVRAIPGGGSPACA